MERGKNFADAKINHIFFKNDSLLFQFAKPEGNHNGETHVVPWQTYSNPHKPHLFDHFSLAKYIFTYPQLLG